MLMLTLTHASAFMYISELNFENQLFDRNSLKGIINIYTTI